MPRGCPARGCRMRHAGCAALNTGRVAPDKGAAAAQRNTNLACAPSGVPASLPARAAQWTACRMRAGLSFTARCWPATCSGCRRAASTPTRRARTSPAPRRRPSPRRPPRCTQTYCSASWRPGSASSLRRTRSGARGGTTRSGRLWPRRGTGCTPSWRSRRCGSGAVHPVRRACSCLRARGVMHVDYGCGRCNVAPRLAMGMVLDSAIHTLTVGHAEKCWERHSAACRARCPHHSAAPARPCGFTVQTQ